MRCEDKETVCAANVEALEVVLIVFLDHSSARIAQALKQIVESAALDICGQGLLLAVCAGAGATTVVGSTATRRLEEEAFGLVKKVFDECQVIGAPSAGRLVRLPILRGAGVLAVLVDVEHLVSHVHILAHVGQRISLLVERLGDAENVFRRGSAVATRRCCTDQTRSGLLGSCGRVLRR